MILLVHQDRRNVLPELDQVWATVLSWSRALHQHWNLVVSEIYPQYTVFSKSKEAAP